MRGTFKFLGTSASAGVPVIGCKCHVCASLSPKDKRFRPSGFIQAGGKNLLIDIGPDFRSQALQFHIDSIDGLLLTHTHYDHIAGLDEIRIFNVRQKKAFPCLLSKESLQDVQKRYYYMFIDKEVSAKIDFTPLQHDIGQTDFLGLQIHYFSYFQSEMKVTGFRLGDFAYVTDIQKYEESIFTALKGVRKLVISALKPQPSPFHFSFDEAIAFQKKVGAHETWITHVGHFLDHDSLNALLPPQIRVAYDGLELEFSCTN